MWTYEARSQFGRLPSLLKARTPARKAAAGARATAATGPLLEICVWAEAEAVSERFNAGMTGRADKGRILTGSKYEKLGPYALLPCVGGFRSMGPGLVYGI